MHYDLGNNQRPATDGIKTIFTIPEGYRPSLQYTKYEIYIDNNSYFWRFNPDGTVTLQSVTDISGHSVFGWSVISLGLYNYIAAIHVNEMLNAADESLKILAVKSFRCSICN